MERKPLLSCCPFSVSRPAQWSPSVYFATSSLFVILGLRWLNTDMTSAYARPLRACTCLSLTRYKRILFTRATFLRLLEKSPSMSKIGEIKQYQTVCRLTDVPWLTYFPKPSSFWWAAYISLLLLEEGWCCLCPERLWPQGGSSSCLEAAGWLPGPLCTLLIKRSHLLSVSCWESYFGPAALQQLFSAWPCSPLEEDATWSNPVTTSREDPSHLWENPRFLPVRLFLGSCMSSFQQLLPLPPASQQQR